MCVYLCAYKCTYVAHLEDYARIEQEQLKKEMKGNKRTYSFDSLKNPNNQKAVKATHQNHHNFSEVQVKIILLRYVHTYFSFVTFNGKRLTYSLKEPVKDKTFLC